MKRLGLLLVLSSAIALPVLFPSASGADEPEYPATPTLSDITLLTPVVQDGENIELAWTGDTGGQELFKVEATYHDFDWGSHIIIDGEGDAPTTGTMRATVDEEWASGRAVPDSVEIFDELGNGRIYSWYSTKVYADGQFVGYESDDFQLFQNLAVTIRENVEDTEAPVLTELSLSDQEIEPGDTITLNWAGMDDHTGIWGIGYELIDPWDDYSYGEHDFGGQRPPPSGQIEIEIPVNAPVGIYQIHRVWLTDNACNARAYWLGYEPMTSTPDCGLAGGGDDYETRAPSALSIAPLVFAVGMPLPNQVTPEPVTDLGVRWANNAWTVDWDSTTEPWHTPMTDFFARGYLVQLDDLPYTYEAYDTVFNLPGPLEPGSHTVSVRVLNRFGFSRWSEPVTFDTRPIGRARSLTVIGNVSGARLSWTPPETDQEIRYVVNVSPQWRLGGTTRKTYFHATALEPGRDYTFAVSAVDPEGQVSKGITAVLQGTRTTVRQQDLQAGRSTILHGRVVADSEGLANVRLVLQRAPEADPASFSATRHVTRTNDVGRYVFELAPRDGFVYRVLMPGSRGLGASWTPTLR